MALTINWNTLSIKDWENNFSQISHSNYFQSYPYARAACPIERQKARWGLIEINGKQAGLVQMFEAGILWNLIHAVMIDRGPLWFEGFGGAMHVKLFCDEWNRQFPKRFARKRRFIPEIEDGPTARKMLEGTGLVLNPAHHGFETFWLDLTKPDEALYAGFSSAWRESLGQAEGANIQVECDVKAKNLNWLSGLYTLQKSLGPRSGPSPEILKRYADILAASEDLILLRAIKDSVPVAYVLLLCHGRSATYLDGWSSEEGIRTGAQHFLFWNGISLLKQKGIKELDLGGTDKDGTDDTKHFKTGLGGRRYRSIGHYS